MYIKFSNFLWIKKTHEIHENLNPTKITTHMVFYDYDTIWLVVLKGIKFHGLASLDSFVGLYLCGIPTCIVITLSYS